MRVKLLIMIVFLSAITSYADNELVLETMKVTAQKYEQKENKTTGSFTVLSDIGIENKNIVNLKDLSMFSANVSVKADNVGNSIVIRGMSPLFMMWKGLKYLKVLREHSTGKTSL